MKPIRILGIPFAFTWIYLTLMFIATAFIATQSDTAAAFDAAVVEYLYAIRGPVFASLFSVITFFGGFYAVAFLSVAGVIGLYLRKRKGYAFGLALAVLGATISDLVLKGIIGRDRPDALFAYLTEITSSFPSGHAAVAMALYGFLAFVMWNLGNTRNRKILGAGAFVVLAVLVGISRVYLGVHYPTDIIAGYILGLLWVAIAVDVNRLRARPLDSRSTRY